MSEYLFQLDALYDEYLRDMERIANEHFDLRGAFSRIFGGSAAGPGSDSCNDRFSDGVKQCADRLAANSPSSQDAADLIGYVMRQDSVRKCSQGALLMMQAVHGCVLPLVEYLSPEDAQMLSKEYGGLLSGAAPLPVQKQLASALNKRAETSS